MGIKSILDENNHYSLDLRFSLLFIRSMDRMEIPRLKHAVLTGKILVAVEPEIEKDLKDLKHNHDVDISEWLRRLIRSELPRLKEQVCK